MPATAVILPPSIRIVWRAAIGALDPAIKYTQSIARDGAAVMDAVPLNHGRE
jgi:hypothetical protein